MTTNLLDDLLITSTAVIRLVYFIFNWIIYSISSFISLITIRIPLILYWGTTLTLKLTFTHISILLLLLLSSLSYIWKVKYLNRYSTLVEAPLTKQDESFDLHPDAANSTSSGGFQNYLDEFLSAIRIFGFLEKPVFHELARHLQTRRLLAGETLTLGTDFFIVIDGSVQVYGKTQIGVNENAKDAYDDEDNNGYQLLNNVESGGTLSSLFTILSLFTEDVSLRYEEEKDLDINTTSSFKSDQQNDANLTSEKCQQNADVISMHLEESRQNPPLKSSPLSRETPLDPQALSFNIDVPIVEHPCIIDHIPTVLVEPDLHFSTFMSSDDLGNSQQNSSSTNAEQEKLDINSEVTIARATIDTTLAVIPAEAFRGLTKKFPNAAAHIVQVILTRLQRVTFLTAHKYLGLTREVIRTEKAINEFACYPLVNEFWENGSIDRLRQNLSTNTKSTSYNTTRNTTCKSNTSSEKGTANNSEYITLDTPYNGPSMGPSSLWESSQHEQFLLPHSTEPVEDNLDEDMRLRNAVMASISKAIGLIQPSITPTHSNDASPIFKAQDFKPQDGILHKAVLTSSFRSLSLLGLQGQEDDSSTNAGSSIASHPVIEIKNEIEILYFPQGSTIISAGQKNAGLYFVIEGFLDVSIPDEGEPTLSDSKSNLNKTSTDAQNITQQSTRIKEDLKKSSTPKLPPFSRREQYSSGASFQSNSLPPLGKPEQSKSTSLFTIKAGGIAGYLSSLSGFPSLVNISSKTDTYVGFLPAKTLERIMDKQPIVLLTLSKRLISLLSPLILHLDSALDWVHVNAGQVIYRQGDASNSFYIVINGRIRSIIEKSEGQINPDAEFGQGESVGELDCITGSVRGSSLVAIRDSELVRIPITLFNAISVRHPLVTIQISRIIASRVREQMNASILPSINSKGLNSGNTNLKTIAILPVNKHVPVTEFASKLHYALQNMGTPTSYLNQATIMQVLGRHAFSKMGTLKLAGWLAENEQKYRIVLYVVDTSVNSSWSETCLRSADCILVVADAGMEPILGEYEKLLIGMKLTARKELILLHPERNVAPGSTKLWLKLRPWIHEHHHVEMTTQNGTVKPDHTSSITSFKNIAKRVEIQIGIYKKNTSSGSQPSRPPAMSDFARIARRLCGKSIGIVLGGGGARGIAHLGVLRALSEKGIPIDMVGGTSIGSLVGGLYAREGDLVSTYGRTKRFCSRMSTLWRVLTDLTYPVVAYTTGHEFNRGIYKSFYDLQIEDMWLSFHCNTTNITHSRMEVHTTGYAWRYVRASMSLVGLLPPLCDGGNMLVDGGYMVSTMLGMGAATVFAVDVAAIDDTNPRNYGESVSGWYVLLQRWNPFSTTPNIPNITEIQSRLTYVSSVKTLEEAKATPGVLYMRMPVTQFGTMEFKKFQELLDIGHNAARAMLADWDSAGKLPTGKEGEANHEIVQRRTQSTRRNSI